MLLIIEKVIVLKTVDIFNDIPDRTLADLADLTTEVHLEAGEQLFAKGDFGDSLYIIISGGVRVHADGHTVNHLHERDIFGEMAILDPEPRAASITAVSDTHLLRLDQDALYELIDLHTEVARGIIRVLSRRMRGLIQDLNSIRN
ncbi:MAG: cyclic nucleotide-binding domain-containing protein [Chloroflexota bacterium]